MIKYICDNCLREEKSRCGVPRNEIFSREFDLSTASGAYIRRIHLGELCKNCHKVISKEIKSLAKKNWKELEDEIYKITSYKR